MMKKTILTYPAIALLMLIGCAQNDESDAPPASQINDTDAVTDAEAGPANMQGQGTALGEANAASKSCVAERGREEAARLAKVCREVSPATSPPCNPENTCQDIVGEIERACSLPGFEDIPQCSDGST